MPFMAVLPALISGGLGLAGTALSTHSANNQAQQQLQLQREQLDLARKQEARAAELYGIAKPEIGKVTGGFDTLEEYYRALMGTGPDATRRRNEILGPYRDSTATQAQNAMKSSALMGPRGSGASSYANISHEQMKSNNQALLGLMAKSPEDLLNVTGQRGNFTASLLGNTGTYSNSATAGLAYAGQTLNSALDRQNSGSEGLLGLGQLLGQSLHDYSTTRNQRSGSRARTASLGSYANLNIPSNTNSAGAITPLNPGQVTW